LNGDRLHGYHFSVVQPQGVRWELGYNETIHHYLFPAMAVSTDTDLKEVTSALAKLTESIATLSQRVEVGFAQIDTKLAQMDTKLAETKADLKSDIQRLDSKVDTKLSDLKGEMNVKFAQVDTKLAKIDGDILLLRQPRDFADFVKRAIASGLVVTVVGGLLLAAGKLLLFGTV
jgi:peptidoglycan hydrolase CwlO-like protein